MLFTRGLCITSYNIALLGMPGSGKGIFSSYLEKLGYHKIGIGTILRALARAPTQSGLELQQYINHGRLIPDTLVCKITFDAIHNSDPKNKPFVIEGFPNTLSQYHAFIEFLEKQPDYYQTQFIYLEIDEKIAISRIKYRLICCRCENIYNLITNPPSVNNQCNDCHGALIKRKEDSFACARLRIENYKEKIGPILNLVKQCQQYIVIKQGVYNGNDKNTIKK